MGSRDSSLQMHPTHPGQKKQSPPASQKPADVYIPAITTSSQWGERTSMSLSWFCFTPHTAHNFENRASLKWISTICVCERELQMYSFASLSHTRVHATECTGVCLPECRQRETTNVYLPATSPFRAEAAESSAAPRSLRTSCSFLLAAMKSNQSAAISSWTYLCL